MERYEPEYSEEVETDLGGMQGSISNTYTLVPQAQGKYPIPPVSFTYFDLESETYKTLTSEEIVIDVGAPPAGIAGTTTPGTVPPPDADQFRYIKLEAGLEVADKRPFFNSGLFWGLFLGPLLLLPIAVLLRKKKREKAGDVKGNRIRKADRLARKYLSEARKHIGDQQKFYESLERALHNYLKAKLHIQTSEMSKEHIQDLLLSRGVSGQAVEDFLGIVKACEFARYTPASNVTMKQDYQKAVGVISEIDKQI